MSYAALPQLRVLAGQWGPDRLNHPLLLAAAIVASNDGPMHPRAVRRRYPDDLTALRNLTEHSLDLPELRSDPTSFVYLLQSLRAFQGDELWGLELDRLVNGEFEVECPSCEEQFNLETIDFDATLLDSHDAPVPMTPRPPAELNGIGAELRPATTNSTSLIRDDAGLAHMPDSAAGPRARGSRGDLRRRAQPARYVSSPVGRCVTGVHGWQFRESGRRWRPARRGVSRHR